MREPWRLQYLKSVFLKIPLVTTWSVFQNQVTYAFAVSDFLDIVIINLFEGYCTSLILCESIISNVLIFVVYTRREKFSKIVTDSLTIKNFITTHIRSCTHMLKHTHAITRTHAHNHTYTHAHTHTHTRAHTHTRTHTHAHTHTHTHTRYH